IKDRKRKIICYYISSNVLLDNAISCIEGIKVLFHNKEVHTVVVSTIKIWNGGNEIIEASDFYPKKDLKVSVPNSEKILAANIVEQKESTCKAEIRIVSENEALFTFYCLEPKQGAIINIYHTNINEKGTNIDGKIKGGKIINKSVEMFIVEGELVVSNGKYNISIGSNLFDMLSIFPRIMGVNISKRIKK
ncbi:hypothetical protein QVN85_05690, partial [Oscillibacter valericigenes]|nr:hypothetical protein [Oscillibacter valericigenes]